MYSTAPGDVSKIIKGIKIKRETLIERERERKREMITEERKGKNDEEELR